MKDIIDTIRREFDQIPVIDTHSHVMPSSDLYDHNQDFLANLIQQYIQDDLKSAGMSRQEFDFIINPAINIKERFKILKPYWKLVFNTGYSRLARETLKMIYEEVELTENNIISIEEQYKRNMRDNTFFDYVLKEKCNIKKVISDHSHYDGIDIPHDKNIFLPAYRLDYLILPDSTSAMRRIEKECGHTLNTFDDMVDAIHIIMERAKKNGAICYKSGLAYNRSLYYEFPDYHDARRGFEELRRAKISLPDQMEYSLHPTKAFQDYMMHEILSIADKENAVYQFHTGIQVGQGNIISNSDPSLLNNIFVEYRNVKFDIFHGGYPYFYQLGALAKQFPNVYVDLCWMHTISPHDTRTALRSWLDTVPISKILGFGDDVHGIEAVAGQLGVARDNICRVLAEEIHDGLRNYDECSYVLRRILYDNPAELYGI